MQSQPTGSSEYKDAFSAYVKRGEEKALSIGSNPDGGYLVPTETETEITRLLTEISPIRSIASVQQVSSSVYKKPITIAGPAVGWVAETASRSQTNSQTIDAVTFATAGALRHARRPPRRPSSTTPRSMSASGSPTR